jgi:hypothetical protein
MCGILKTIIVFIFLKILKYMQVTKVLVNSTHRKARLSILWKIINNEWRKEKNKQINKKYNKQMNESTDK